MKSFLKKRWHHLPVSIITAILLVCLLAGGAFAAYPFFAGNAHVTVVEALTVTNIVGDDGDFTGQAGNYSWDVSLYPGESESLCVLVSNEAPNELEISTECSPGVVGISASWAGAASVAGGGSEVLTLTVTAAQSASPGGPQNVYFKIERGS